MEKVRFAIVGGAGWRAQFFLHIAAALPERFEVCAAVVRNEEKARQQEENWDVKTYRTLDAMLEASDPLFVVVSVTRGSAPDILSVLSDRGVPALCETPPAEDVETLTRMCELVRGGAKIQVAEQYIFQPMHAGRLAIVQSGKLGAVTQAQVSCAHGYHGVSLIRHLLGVRFEEATISGFRFTSPIVAGPGRSGAPVEEKVRDSIQNVAYLDFGGKLGVLDFTGDQYFSWIRSDRVLVRGERGEINNTYVRYLRDYLTPIESELHRVDTGHGGSLEGYYHKGIVAAGEWVYRNPFAPGRLSDEEIAIATTLSGMSEYVRTGTDFYSLPDAAQDRYLDLEITRAIETGKTIRTTAQGWAEL